MAVYRVILHQKSGTYQYQEVLFLTGAPVILSGTVQIPSDPDEDETDYSLTYKYTLQNADGTTTLDRSVTYDVTKTTNDTFQQTQYKAKISKLSEDITIDSDTYELDGYLFTKSLLYDNTPAVDYYAGTLYNKRIYYKMGCHY